MATLRVSAPQHLSAACDEVAAELLAEAGWIEPPVDAFELASQLGYEIAFDARQEARGRIKRLAGKPTVFLSPDLRPERLQWAAAHEIGESAAWQVFERLDQDPRTVRANVREQVANWLAGRLLIPSRWWHTSGAEMDWDLLALKHRFSTASHELLARRMLEAEPPVVITSSRSATRSPGRSARSPSTSFAEPWSFFSLRT